MDNKFSLLLLVGKVYPVRWLGPSDTHEIKEAYNWEREGRALAQLHLKWYISQIQQ